MDSRTDVAVIQIPPDHLVALQWAGPEEVKRGQWVIAVGSPMGFGGSVTSGIISAPSTRNRFFGNGQPGEFTANPNDPYAVEDYIQTDAAINPGNSGGPLLSLDGKVVGINTLIVSSTFSSAGLGFAVPQRLAQPVVEALIQNGRVVRGHLGVAIIEPSKLTTTPPGTISGCATPTRSSTSSISARTTRAASSSRSCPAGRRTRRASRKAT